MTECAEDCSAEEQTADCKAAAVAKNPVQVCITSWPARIRMPYHTARSQALTGNSICARVSISKDSHEGEHG